ncbi:MAG TPA: TetR/AcrR family transcriptional regulator [Caulobacteraceae bacterium]
MRHILRESLDCFSEQGFENATYDDLIRRSRVSRGSFYWYFPSKEALYEAVLDFCVAGYVERLEAAWALTDPDEPVIKRLFAAVLADFNAHRAQYRLLLRPPPSKSAIDKLAQWNDEATAFIAGKLAPLVREGRLDQATADILPDVLSAFLDGVCVRLVLEDEPSVQALSENIETFLCRIVAT